MAWHASLSRMCSVSIHKQYIGHTPPHMFASEFLSSHICCMCGCMRYLCLHNALRNCHTIFRVCITLSSSVTLFRVCITLDTSVICKLVLGAVSSIAVAVRENQLYDNMLLAAYWYLPSSIMAAWHGKTPREGWCILVKVSFTRKLNMCVSSEQQRPDVIGLCQPITSISRQSAPSDDHLLISAPSILLQIFDEFMYGLSILLNLGNGRAGFQALHVSIFIYLSRKGRYGVWALEQVHFISVNLPPPCGR